MPTVGDRVAQTVVARRIEEKVEVIFHPDSYGYRPRRSALDAVAACRQRCWRYDWVVDLDVQAFFDSVDYDLVIRAVACRSDPAARRQPATPRPGNPARVRGLTVLANLFPALRVRHVDGPDISVRAVRARRRRCRGALHQRTPGTLRAPGDRGTGGQRSGCACTRTRSTDGSATPQGPNRVGTPHRARPTLLRALGLVP